MKLILNLIIRILAVVIAASLIPGVVVEGFAAALVLVVVLGVLNTVVKPIIILLTIPVNFLTLGLFTFVINGFIVLLVSLLVDGFSVSSFWTGLLFSIVLSLVNGFLNTLKK